MEDKKLYTIGHSTMEIQEFVDLLKSFGIKTLGDVRAFPMSRRQPQFNKENLDQALTHEGISYIHLPELGGRRSFDSEKPDYGWRHKSFAGYAQYQQTDEFRDAIQKVENMAEKEPTAIMCAEKLWWKCHRRMISDYMENQGWDVLHILDRGKFDRHVISPQFKGHQASLF